MATNIQRVSLADRMEQAFLDYSMSVIVGRALPDVRDGLKPVQRRILYSMWESGLRPSKPHRKCASAVGEVMKKYHPHGDQAIYDALVRMGQDFSTRELLVDGHGNFGSIDGDPPAAMRYTEARLSLAAMELMAGIDEETVDFIPNYDGYDREPTVIPGRFPNLLVNGATGIAVGMATNIPPHNLGETIDACLAMIVDPDIDLDGLMEHIPAPDFPTGARIVDSSTIRESYATGRGAVTCEAVATTEVRSGGMPRIIITEIPYQVNKSSLLTKIADLVAKKKVPAIRDLRDESSRDGMRIVIELKRGEDPARVLDKLYKSTELRTNFNVNMVALVGGAPQTLGLVDILRHYLDHQRTVLTRRTQHRLDRASARAHIVEGLLVAIDNLDEIIALIRAAGSASEARADLIANWEFSDAQATAVLDMMLRRLARMEREELEDEYQQLTELIASLEEILGDTARLDEVLTEELTEIRRVHATGRRSRIVEQGITSDDVLAGGADAGFEAQDVTVLITQAGVVKPISQRRTTPAHNATRDPLAAVVRCTTDDQLLLIAADGMGYRLGVGDAPVVRANNRGTPIGQLTGQNPDAAIVAAVPIVLGASLVIATAGGQVKRTSMEEYDSRTSSVQVTGLKGDDRVVAAALCLDGDDLITASAAGQLLRFSTDDVREMGRTASGVNGMNVGKAELAGLAVLPEGEDTHDGEAAELVLLALSGEAKRIPTSSINRKGRGGKGVQSGLDSLAAISDAADIHADSDGWKVIRPVEVKEASRTASGTEVVGTVRSAVVELHAPGDFE